MRKKEKSGPLSVHAIAGTYVVLLGIDMEETASSGVLGFAIERTDHTEDERYWLRGLRTFQATDPGCPGCWSLAIHRKFIRDSSLCALIGPNERSTRIWRESG